MATKHRNPAARLASAIALGTKASYFPRANFGSSWFLPPAGYVDGMLSGVGNGRGNSIVEASLGYLARTFPEAPMAVYEDDPDGKPIKVPGHPAEELLAIPNPVMVGEDLSNYEIMALNVDGNGYIWKQRSIGGEIIALWPLMPDLVTPKGNESATTMEDQWIEHYEYRPAGQLTRINRADMVHLRDGFDPDEPRLGQSKLKAVLREVLGDELAGQFAVGLLKNMGVPGVVLSPKNKSEGPSPVDAEAMEDVWRDKFTGDKRGGAYVISGGAMDVKIVGFSPEQMNFRDLARLPEERISGVLGVPAILAGLGAGLERAIESNLQGLREHYTETTLVPAWRVSGSRWTAALMPDIDPGAGRVIVHELTAVRALQPDLDALWKRNAEAVNGGYAMISDARKAVGLPTDVTHEVFVLPAGKIVISSDGLQAEAELDIAPPDDDDDDDGD